MKAASVRTLRNDYAKLLRRVEAGEEIAIARRGRVVARLVPAQPRQGKVDWANSASFRVLKGQKMLPLSGQEVLDLIHDAQGGW